MIVDQSAITAIANAPRSKAVVHTARLRGYKEIHWPEDGYVPGRSRQGHAVQTTVHPKELCEWIGAFTDYSTACTRLADRRSARFKHVVIPACRCVS